MNLFPVVKEDFFQWNKNIFRYGDKPGILEHAHLLPQLHRHATCGLRNQRLEIWGSMIQSIILPIRVAPVPRMRQTLIIGFFLSLLSSGLGSDRTTRHGSSGKGKILWILRGGSSSGKMFLNPGFVSKLHMHGCGPNQHRSDPKQNYKLKTDQFQVPDCPLGALHMQYRLKQHCKGCEPFTDTTERRPVGTYSLNHQYPQHDKNKYTVVPWCPQRTGFPSSWQMPKSMDAHPDIMSRIPWWVQWLRVYGFNLWSGTNIPHAMEHLSLTATTTELMHRNQRVCAPQPRTKELNNI